MTTNVSGMGSKRATAEQALSVRRTDDDGPQPTRRIVFLTSSALHVRLFSEAINELGAAACSWNLDAYNDLPFGGTSVAEALRRDIATVTLPFQRRGSTRHPLFIATNIVAQRQVGRKIVRPLLEKGASLLVVGSDVGRCERIVLRRAASLGIPSVLVQDGFLASSLWSPRNRRGYGSGGATHFATMEPAECLDELRRTTRQSVHRISLPQCAMPGSVPGPQWTDRESVLYVASNFIQAFRDRQTHEAQLREIRDIRSLLDGSNHRSLTLLVRPHPVEGPGSFDALKDVRGIDVDTGSLDESLRRSRVVVGNFTFAVIEASNAGIGGFLSSVSLPQRYLTAFRSFRASKTQSASERDRVLLAALEPEASAALANRTMMEWFGTNNDEPSESLASLIRRLTP